MRSVAAGNVLFVLVVAISAPAVAPAAPAATPAQEKLAMPILMGMLEKQSLLTLSKLENDETEPARMTDSQLASTTTWLKSLKFGQFGGVIRQDFEAYRKALLKTCAEPPTGGYDAGYAQGELDMEFWPLMVDFDLDGAKARKYGYGRLASGVDTAATIACAYVQVMVKLDTQRLRELPPATQIIATMVQMFDHLAAVQERAPSLQASLYGLHPEQVPDEKQRVALQAAKTNLIRLSHCPSERDPDRLRYTLSSLDAICHAHKLCQIADAGLKRAGGDTLAKMQALLKYRSDSGRR